MNIFKQNSCEQAPLCQHLFFFFWGSGLTLGTVKIVWLTSLCFCIWKTEEKLVLSTSPYTCCLAQVETDLPNRSLINRAWIHLNIVKTFQVLETYPARHRRWVLLKKQFQMLSITCFWPWLEICFKWPNGIKKYTSFFLLQWLRPTPTWSLFIVTRSK